MKHLLITAETDEAHQLIDALNSLKKEPLHLPLEKYRFALDRLQHELLIEELERFRFVIYGVKRNTRFFLTWIVQTGLLDEMRSKIHLVMNQSEADMLEEAGIPAILPRDGASAIDMRKNGWNPRLFEQDRKSTRLNSSHVAISYAVFSLKKKKTHIV